MKYSKGIITIVILGFLFMNGCSLRIDKNEDKSKNIEKTSKTENTYVESPMENQEKDKDSSSLGGVIFPYEYTKQETELLQLLGKNNDIRIISFQAPEGTKAIEVKTVVLNEEKEWVDEQAVSMFFDYSLGRPILSGKVVIEIQEDKRLKIIIDAMGRTTFYSHIDDRILDKKFEVSHNEVISESNVVTIDQETPVFISSYRNDGFPLVNRLGNYNDTSKLEYYDLVQAVTITFKDEINEGKID